MAIEPIVKVSVNEQVFEQMKQQLLEGVWKPGQKLPSENELTNMFHVSRITVRNALQKLAILGLIETRRGDGSYVLDNSLGTCLNPLVPAAFLNDNIIEVQEFRLMIEPGAARLAAIRANQDDVDDLRAHLVRMQSIEHDYIALAKEDFAFHNKIGLITRNSLMIRTYEILNDVLQSTMENVVKTMGSDLGLYFHGQIVDAIANHDGSQAYEIMYHHIESNIAQYNQ